jgi:hypothetical protein
VASTALFAWLAGVLLGLLELSLRPLLLPHALLELPLLLALLHLELLGDHGPAQLVAPSVEVLGEDPRIAKRAAVLVHELEGVSDLLLQGPEVVVPDVGQDGVDLAVEGVADEGDGRRAPAGLRVVAGGRHGVDGLALGGSVQLGSSARRAPRRSTATFSSQRSSRAESFSARMRHRFPRLSFASWRDRNPGWAGKR